MDGRRRCIARLVVVLGTLSLPGDAGFCAVAPQQPLRGVRVNKVFTADFSRREADRLVADGRVAINGEVATPGDRVVPGDEVRLDGRPFSSASAFAEAHELLGGAAPSTEAGAAFVYLKYWKPRGVTCTTDRKVRGNLIDALGFDGPERLFPVGRLDKESEGLLLMTNDGRAINAINRAARSHEKVYEVECDRPVSEVHLRELARGVVITTTAQRDRGPDRVLTAPTRPCRVSRLGPRSFRIVLTEGRNRQIRRMCEAVGRYDVTTLHRASVMGIGLDGLPAPGAHAPLVGPDLAAVLDAIEEAQRSPLPPPSPSASQSASAASDAGGWARASGRAGAGGASEGGRRGWRGEGRGGARGGGGGRGRGGRGGGGGGGRGGRGSGRARGGGAAAGRGAAPGGLGARYRARQLARTDDEW